MTLLRSRLLKDVFASIRNAPLRILADSAPTTSGSTPPRGNKRYWEPAEIHWVKTGEIAFAPITTTEESVSELALAECSLPLLPRKTVLVAMYGQGKTRGQSALLEIPATTNQACFAILPSETWIPEFLYYWLVANYQELRRLSQDRGGNQANLNGVLLRALRVPAPQRSEQLRIIQFIEPALAKMDELHMAHRGMRADLEQLPQRLLAGAFES
jgi:type I restriction enzyme S subunit